MSCKKNLGKSKIQSENLPDNIKLLKFYGGDNIIEEYSEYIHLQCSDYYEDLPLKILNIIKYININFPGTGIIKIDDNLDIFDRNQLAYISNKLSVSDVNYCGQIRDKRYANRRWHFGKCNSNHLNFKEYNRDILFDWCDGGHGYYLSPYSVMSIVNLYGTDPREHLYEDMMIGEFLGLNDIYPVNYSMLSGLFYDPYLSENSLC